MFVTPAYGQEAAPADAGADTHAGTEVPGNAAHEGGGFPPFDSATFASQLVWLAITFGLFYVFLKRVIVPRLGTILDTRAGRIQQDLDQAAKLKGEADAAVAAYEQELAEARRKANTIGQDARDKAKAAAEAERRKVEDKLNGDLAAAEERIASIKRTAMKDVDQIASDTASAIIQQLLGTRVDGKDVAAAVKSSAR
jgi:F-type H+-transporting ATPase subunit b